MSFDTDLDEKEEEKEPTPLAADGRQYPVWYYAGKLQQLASQNKVRSFSRRKKEKKMYSNFSIRFKKHWIISTMK